MYSAVVVLISVPETEAQNLARALVEQRLAACVTHLSGARAVYRWGDRLAEDNQPTLIVKTLRGALSRLEKVVRDATTEDVYELLVLDVTGGNQRYIEWMRSEVSVLPTDQR